MFCNFLVTIFYKNSIKNNSKIFDLLFLLIGIVQKFHKSYVTHISVSYSSHLILPLLKTFKLSLIKIILLFRRHQNNSTLCFLSWTFLFLVMWIEFWLAFSLLLSWSCNTCTFFTMVCSLYWSSFNPQKSYDNRARKNTQK